MYDGRPLEFLFTLPKNVCRTFANDSQCTQNFQNYQKIYTLLNSCQHRTSAVHTMNIPHMSSILLLKDLCTIPKGYTQCKYPYLHGTSAVRTMKVPWISYIVTPKDVHMTLRNDSTVCAITKGYKLCEYTCLHKRPTVRTIKVPGMSCIELLKDVRRTFTNVQCVYNHQRKYANHRQMELSHINYINSCVNIYIFTGHGPRTIGQAPVCGVMLFWPTKFYKVAASQM